MHETRADLLALQALLDRSNDAAGPHLRSVFTEPRHLDAVTLTGAIPHDAVATWMSAADVLALVSRVEPLGVVALEALASGRPVVATQEGGAREVIPPYCGALIAPGNPIAIADAVADVIARRPSPSACRAAADLHALTRQAAIVDQILQGAVSGHLPTEHRA